MSENKRPNLRAYRQAAGPNPSDPSGPRGIDMFADFVGNVQKGTPAPSGHMRGPPRDASGERQIGWVKEKGVIGMYKLRK